MRRRAVDAERGQERALADRPGDAHALDRCRGAQRREIDMRGEVAVAGLLERIGELVAAHRL